MKSFYKESKRIRHKDHKKYWDIYVTDDNYDTYVASYAFEKEPTSSEISDVWKSKRSQFKLC